MNGPTQEIPGPCEPRHEPPPIASQSATGADQIAPTSRKQSKCGRRRHGPDSAVHYGFAERAQMGPRRAPNPGNEAIPTPGGASDRSPTSSHSPRAHQSVPTCNQPELQLREACTVRETWRRTIPCEPASRESHSLESLPDRQFESQRHAIAPEYETLRVRSGLSSC